MTKVSDLFARTQDWSVLQAVIGQKGKQSLKRQTLRCSIDRVDVVRAMKAKKALAHFTLEQVKSQSAGAAVFYLWVSLVRDLHAESRLRSLFLCVRQ